MSMINQVAYAILEALLNSLWQSVLLVSVAICILYILRNRNAATRYLILWIILLILAFMPFAEVLLGISKIINPVFVTLSSEETINNPYQINASWPGMVFNGYFPQFKPINIPIPLKILPFLILCLLAMAVIFTLSRLLRSFFYTSKLKKNLSVISPENRERFREYFEINNIKRKVALYAPSNIRMPMAIGLFNPAILIPNSLIDKLTDEQLKQVVFHELAHIRRWDDWTNLIQRIIETFFFWHPLILYIARRLDLEREIACDDWVITLSGESKSYALCLTKLIEFNMFTSNQPMAIGVALRRKHITTRISMLLSKGRNTNPYFSLFDIFASVFITILAFAVFVKITPALALVRQQNDNLKPVIETENILVEEPYVIQEQELSLPNEVAQESNKETISTSEKTQEKVKSASEINLVKAHPKVIVGSKKIIKLDTPILAKPQNIEPEEPRTKAIDVPSKNYKPTFLYNVDDQPKELHTEEPNSPPESEKSENNISKPDDKPGRAKELLTNLKESSQEAISSVGAVADDKSEKIGRRVTDTFVGFGGELKESAIKLGDKASSGKNGIKNRAGSLYRSIKRKIAN